MRPRPLLLAAALAACDADPTPLPTAAAVAEVDRNQQPPLYQLLYDAPTTPAASAQQQRVRMLVWLRHLQLTEDQLDRLDDLRVLVAERSQRLATAEQELVDRYAEQEAEIYGELWEALSRGAPVDAPEMGDATESLRNLRAGGERERTLLALKMEGMRSLLDAQQGFLRTLTPRQEALFADSLFFLRHRLDPVGNPGDFKSIVGSVYEPGQFDVLTRGDSEAARERLNIGGLWSDRPGLDGHELHEARREVLLFLALQEPGLDEAIAAARALAGEAIPGSAGGPPTAPPGEPAPPAPGVDAPTPAPPPSDGSPPPEGALAPTPGGP
jgi:hypothetical protein